MSHLSPEFSVSGEGSSNLAMSDKADTGRNLGEEESKSSESPTNSSMFQFHFSIYKWASKGVPMVMPHRGRRSSRVQKATKNEQHSSTYESPISTLPNIDCISNDLPLADSTSSKLESNKQENDLLLDESTPDKVKVEPCQFIKDTILPVVESSVTFSSLPSTVEDIACSIISCQTSEDPLLQTANCEDPQKKVPVPMEQVHKPEIKPTHSLIFDDDLEQGMHVVLWINCHGPHVAPLTPHLCFHIYAGTDKITKLAGRKENPVKAAKKSSVDGGSSRNVENQNGERISLTNVQGSLPNSEDNLGKNKAKGKVKDFIKMFNLEVSSKPKDYGDFGSRRFKQKEKSPIESGNEASISTPIMHEELQNSNTKKTFPDASITVINLHWFEFTKPNTDDMLIPFTKYIILFAHFSR